MIDSGVFAALLKTIKQEECAKRFLSREYQAASLRFEELNRVQRGQHFNIVPQCGNALRTIVHEIEVDLQMRQPIATKVCSDFTGAIIGLIQEVCNRNTDLRSGERALARLSHHNLYTYLIGSPLQDGREPWMSNVFGLDALERLPVQYWQSHVAELAEIRDRIQYNVSMVPSQQGSVIFLEKLNDLLTRTQHSASEASRSE